MLKILLRALIVAPTAFFLVALALANRDEVKVSVNPFVVNPNDSWYITAPMFMVMFACALLGIVCGGCAVWFGQGRHRRALRRAKTSTRSARAQTEELRGEIAAMQPLALMGQRELPGLKLRDDAR